MAALATAAAGGTGGEPSIPQSGTAAGVASAGPLSGWTRLELSGRKLLVASGRAAVERWPASDGAPHDLHRVDSGFRALGKRSRDIAYSEVDPVRSRVVRWLEIRPGKKARWARVDAGGEVVVRRFDVPGQPFDPASWTRRYDRRYRLPQPPVGEGEPEPMLLDAWSLLGRLGEVMRSGRPVVLLGKDAARPLALTVSERRSRELTVTDLDRARAIRLRMDVVSLEVRDSASGEAILGMREGVRLWIDASSGALVEVEGKVKGVPGTTRLTLEAFSKRATPRPHVPWPREEPGDARLDEETARP